MSRQHFFITCSISDVISESLKWEIDLSWRFELYHEFFSSSLSTKRASNKPNKCFFLGHACKRSFVDDMGIPKHLRCCDGMANRTTLAYFQPICWPTMLARFAPSFTGYLITMHSKNWDFIYFLQGLGKANVGFLIDTSSVPTRGFLQKLVYNYIRLFQLQGTSFTIYAYGASQQKITIWKSFTSPQDIQVSVKCTYSIISITRASENLNFWLELLLHSPRTFPNIFS